jgi:Heterokaryon incompatibility protein (HET)
MATRNTTVPNQIATSSAIPAPEAFRHQSLPDNSTYFRLATVHPSSRRDGHIRCSLHTYPLAQHPSYTALSYVCGSPNDTSMVHVDGQPLAVYANLKVALSSVRNSKSPLLLWVDARCIYLDRSRIKYCRNLRVELRFCELFGLCVFSVP